MDTTPQTTPIDGRTRRRQRNIDAVVDAVIDLAVAGNLDPTSEEIARIAGISHRSIYRYFDTRAELLDAAVARAFESVSSAFFEQLDTPGSLDDRIAQYVAARFEMSRRFRSMAQAALLHAPSASGALEHARSSLRTQFDDHFSNELERLDPDTRRQVVAVGDVVFQFEALDQLGDVLTDDEVRESLSRHLRALLRSS